MSTPPVPDNSEADQGSAPLVVRDPWSALRAHTPANIAIGRTGHSLPTHEVLRFGLAHAQARDAVHIPLDSARLMSELAAAGWPSVSVHSAAVTPAAARARPICAGRTSGAGCPNPGRCN